MKINDTRSKNVITYWVSLVSGEVYIDAYGRYVMRTDEDAVVSLEDGCLYDDTNYELNHDSFIHVKARMEID